MRSTIFWYSVTIFGVFFSIPLKAQQPTNFIAFNKRAEIGFDSIQEQKLNRIISNPLYKAHYYVSFQDLIAHNVDGTVTINLPSNPIKFLSPDSTDIDGDGVDNLTDITPFDPCIPFENNTNCTGLRPSSFIQHTFYPTTINTHSVSEYVYYGEYDPCGDRTGYVMLVAQNGRFFGQINIDEEVWEIFDLGSKKNLLVFWENTAFPKNECGNIFSEPENNAVKPSEIEFRNTACDVRVLVLFTQRAEEIADPFQRAFIGIRQSNEISRNSRANVCFTLAGVEPFPGFTEVPNDIEQTHTNFRNPFNNIPTQLRNQFEADLVVLFVDTNDPDLAGWSQLNNWGDPQLGAFVTVEIDAANGRFTFTHELAHNFGCKHNTDNRGAPNFVFAARGHQFNAGGETRRTVMTLLPENGERIMHWSNRNVRFKGKRTGQNDRSNAFQIAAMSCTVANYVQSTPPLTAFIDGPVDAPPFGINQYCLWVENCSTWKSSDWEFSFNGFEYFSIPNSQNSLCVVIGMPQTTNLFVRVSVLCESGESFTAFFLTYNNAVGPNPVWCNAGENEYLTGITTDNPSLSIEISPTPSTSSLDVWFDLDENEQIFISIYDMTGHRVITQMGEYTKGMHQLELNIEHLQRGSYVLVYNQGKKQAIKKFIKI